MLKMVAVNTASNYVTAYINPSEIENNNALYNPNFTPTISVLNSTFTNPRLFTRYHNVVMFIDSAGLLRIVNYYNGSLRINTTSIIGSPAN